MEARKPRRGRGGGCTSRASAGSERMDCRRHPLRTYVRTVVKLDIAAGGSPASPSFWRRRSALSSEEWWLWTASTSVVGRSRSRATTATRRASRSLTSRVGSVAQKPRSRRTSTTRLTLTKGTTQASARRASCTAAPAQKADPGLSRTEHTQPWRGGASPTPIPPGARAHANVGGRGGSAPSAAVA